MLPLTSPHLFFPSPLLLEKPAVLGRPAPGLRSQRQDCVGNSLQRVKIPRDSVPLLVSRTHRMRGICNVKNLHIVLSHTRRDETRVYEPASPNDVQCV